MFVAGCEGLEGALFSRTGFVRVHLV